MTIDCLPLYAGLPSVRLASLERIQPYWQNTKVRSRNGLHVGGSALVPCPAAHRVQGCLIGVAGPVIHFFYFYLKNSKVGLRNGLYVGGSALVPCPAAHRVQGCLIGVAVPVIHSFNCLTDLYRVLRVIAPCALLE